MKLHLGIAACSLILGATSYLAVPAHAQSADKTFAEEAASGGMAEVKLGQLAQEKSSNSTVKDFGKRMETDHTKANAQLKEAAERAHITLPNHMNRQDQATYDRLSKLSGTAFDKAYTRDMVSDHEKDIAAFKKEAASGQNPDIKQFASQTLPTLEDHLSAAKQMEQSAGASASAAH